MLTCPRDTWGTFLPPDTATTITFCRQRIGKVQTSKFEAKNLGDCWNFFQITC